ncbi:MAG: hypothetical protein Q4G49_10890 [Paracoccus sp. (in: a-proteobacteria)]|nr:hypothetical protein [Paracoccus sp. (in: a-proteobacteria)]
MANTHDRIWIEDDPDCLCYHDREFPDSIEYVRADLVPTPAPVDRDKLGHFLLDASKGQLTLWDGVTKMADALIAAGYVREPFDPAKTPGHMDMMVSPESLDEWLENNPPPQDDPKVQHAITEATDPDFTWGVLDNVHDAETTLDDYAAAVSRAQRAALSSVLKGDQP